MLAFFAYRSHIRLAERQCEYIASGDTVLQVVGELARVIDDLRSRPIVSAANGRMEIEQGLREATHVAATANNFNRICLDLILH